MFDTDRPRGRLLAYAAATAFMSCALLIRYLLDPYLGESQPLSLLFGAVALAVWVGGVSPAIYGTVLGYFASDFLFIDPRGVIAVRSPQQVVSMVTYITSSAVIIAFGEALRRANARSREYSRSLEGKNRELAAVERRKDDFIATLAHELRTPLSAITHTVEFLKRKLTPCHDASGALGIVERQTQHMKRLIEELLDLASIARGEIRLQNEPVRIVDALETAAETARPAIERHGHRFTLRIDAPDARVNGDLVRLTQVFVNLINNAARYTPDGGEVVVTAQGVGNRLRVKVCDDGIGIAADMIEQVFEMFTQVDNAGARKAGLGIGLALVRRIVELHGGDVSARSEGIGWGSEFTVELPLVSDSAASEFGRAISRAVFEEDSAGGHPRGAVRKGDPSGARSSASEIRSSRSTTRIV